MDTHFICASEPRYAAGVTITMPAITMGGGGGGDSPCGLDGPMPQQPAAHYTVDVTPFLALSAATSLNSNPASGSKPAGTHAHQSPEPRSYDYSQRVLPMKQRLHIFKT